MKKFIYLDNDEINSIIAQVSKGLINDISETSEKGNSKRKTRKFGSSTKALGEGKLFKLAKAEASLSFEGGLDNETNKFQNTKEIITKTLHDAAFEIAYKEIKPQKCEDGDTSNDDYGNYIELNNRVFDFVDLEYLENMFSENGIISYLKTSAEQEIQTEKEKQVGAYNREVKRANKDEFKKIDKMVEDAIKESKKQYDDIEMIIKVLRNIIPYKRMLISNDGYLIPLEDKYFRVNPHNMGFAYGGTITCVGIVTNIIGQSTNPEDDSNVFATLQYSVNEVLRGILPTKEKDLCIVTPIALYYEG